MSRKNKKRVLLISNNGMGFFSFKKELIEKLISLNYETHFAVPFYEKLDELVAAGAIFHELNIDRRGINPIKDLGLIRKLNRMINNVIPDVIILHTIKPNIYVSFLAKAKKIPYINNITGLGSALQNDSRLAKLLRMMYRVTLSRSCGIFFENLGNMYYFKKHHIGEPRKYVVVPGAGVNTERYSPCTRHDSENITFLYVARIMKEKGIEEYLNAAEFMKKNYNNVTFQIVGWYDEDEYENRIEQLIKDEVIQYLGVSSDTRIEMSQADCIVLPSYHEGMSNVLLEGAAMGLPVITTDIHGCKEAVDDGKSGFLCKVRNSESLIDATERFIALSQAERREMGFQGRNKMVKEFDRKIVVNRYVEAIKEAVKE